MGRNWSDVLGDLCKFTHSLIDGSSSSKKNGADSSAKPLKRMSENSTTMEHDEMSSSVRTNQTTTNSPKLAKLELEERPASPNFDSKEEVAAAIDEGLQEENRQLKEKLNQFSRQIEELSSRNQQLHTQNSRLKQAAEEILRCRKPFNGSQVNKCMHYNQWSNLINKMFKITYSNAERVIELWVLLHLPCLHELPQMAEKLEKIHINSGTDIGSLILMVFTTIGENRLAVKDQKQFSTWELDNFNQRVLPIKDVRMYPSPTRDEVSTMPGAHKSNE